MPLMSTFARQFDQGDLTAGLDDLWAQVQGGLPEPAEPHGRMKPDPRLVQALLDTAVQSYVIPRAEPDNAQSPWELLGAVERADARFFPPKELSPDRERTEQALSFWRQWAHYVLWQAQQKAIGRNDPERGYTLTAEFAAAVRAFSQNTKAVKEIRLGTTAGATRAERVWCDVDTRLSGGAPSEAETSREFQGFVDLVRTHLRRGIEIILTDPDINHQIQATVKRLMRIDLEVCLREEVTRLEYIRAQVETPEERAKFLHLFKQLLAIAGCDPEGVEVELLSARDALVHGAQALYKPPAAHGKKATVCIPMSHYGTSQILSLKETIELVAHEAAHDAMERLGQQGHQPAHGLTHDLLEAAMLARLNRCTVTTYSGGWPLVQAPRDILDPATGRAQPVANKVINQSVFPDVTVFDPTTKKLS